MMAVHNNMFPRTHTTRILLASALALACTQLQAQAPAPDQEPNLQAKADALKDQYTHAGASDRKTIGEDLIDADIALAQSLVEQKDYAGAQNVLAQALSTAASIKSDKSRDITARLTSVSVRKSILTRIQTLSDTLIQKPKDPATIRQLVDLYVLELDDIKSAQEAAAPLDDKTLKKNLALASKKTARLSPADALDLATWFTQAATRNTGTTKAAAQAKAGAILKDLLDRENLDAPIKAKARPLFDALPAQAKKASTDAQPDEAIGSMALTPAGLANLIKNAPKDVTTSKPGEDLYNRVNRLNNYLKQSQQTILTKPFRFKGTAGQRISFRKSQSGWEAEVSIYIDTPPDAIKMHAHPRVAVTDKQMQDLSNLSNPELEVEGKFQNIYPYSTSNDGQISTYGIQTMDCKLISFK